MLKLFEKKKLSSLCIFLCCHLLCAQTIEEKLAVLDASSLQNEEETSLPKINRKLGFIRQDLREKYKEVDILIEEKAEEEEFQALLDEINVLRCDLSDLEEKWRRSQVGEMMKESEDYGVWEQEDVTISQLIVEYGSQDYLYVVPPELSAVKLNFHSALMIPRESWSSLLDAIFKHNGIGVRDINPYTKQLYLLKQDHLGISSVVSERVALEALSPETRLVYIYSPPAENLKAAFYFVERFRDPKTTFVYQVGTKIAIVGFQSEVKKLIVLCDNVWEKEEEKVTRVVTTSKLQPEEVIKILKAYFGGLADANRSIISLKGGNDLSVLPLSQDGGVVLVGSRQVVERAEALIRETEAQVDDPFELTVFWYMCSHCDPVDLSEILQQVYSLLICSSFESDDGRGSSEKAERVPEIERGFPGEVPMPNTDLEPYPPQNNRGLAGLPSGQAGGNPVSPWLNPPPETSEDKIKREKPTTFIPNPASGSVLMVVRKDLLPKIKEVISRVDTPKRMVEIEILLCERITTDRMKTGIDLLKIGSPASNTTANGVEFNDPNDSVTGIFKFLHSNTSAKSFPAIDVTYNFLMSQEDMRVSSSPSVTTLNQVPATISVTDQISISNGAAPVSTNGGVIFKESYDRAEYGMIITLTPTVHEPELNDQDQQLYVTLDNEISFETISDLISSDYRPVVHKRQIRNSVRIADGQTIILGGLKRKQSNDKTDKIPFLGDIPGIGKVFGSTALREEANEMFIFIRPKIIEDPKRDLLRIREERLRMRPGDIDHLLNKICEARKRTQVSSLTKTFKLMFGPDEDTTCQL